MQKVRRLKVKNGLKEFVPESVNFSELKKRRATDSGEKEFDVGDEGHSMESIEESIEYEKMVLQMLCNLDMYEKLIFMYQLFRDYGYQIDHGSFAKTLNISRMKYMQMLKMVKIKTLLIVEGRSMMKDTQISMK